MSHVRLRSGRRIINFSPASRGYATTGVARPAYAGYQLQATPTYDVSFDTSSKDPAMMRARVFAGNVNTFVVGRPELIQLFSAYGTMLGMTVFKGYAFIQYATAEEADFAVSCTNGMFWQDQVLDVKLAVTGMKSSPISGGNKLLQANNGYFGTVKRELGDYTGAMMDMSANLAKRPKIADGSGLWGSAAANVIMQNDANQQAATSDKTTSEDLAASPFPDTMICGSCHVVFTDFIPFRDHRRTSCTGIPSKKNDDGPDELICFTCEEMCAGSWALIQHMATKHNLYIYKK